MEDLMDERQSDGITLQYEFCHKSEGADFSCSNRQFFQNITFYVTDEKSAYHLIET